jgi:hypothetical protein
VSSVVKRGQAWSSVVRRGQAWSGVVQVAFDPSLVQPTRCATRRHRARQRLPASEAPRLTSGLPGQQLRQCANRLHFSSRLLTCQLSEEELHVCELDRGFGCTSYARIILAQAALPSSQSKRAPYHPTNGRLEDHRLEDYRLLYLNRRSPSSTARNQRSDLRSDLPWRSLSRSQRVPGWLNTIAPLCWHNATHARALRRCVAPIRLSTLRGRQSVYFSN